MDFIVSLLSNPAVQTIITLGLTTAVGYINRSWAKQARWDVVTRIATSVVTELYGKGLSKWEDVARMAMKLIEEEVKGHPGVDNLSESEVERLKPFVVALARRKNGVLDHPTP